MNEPKYLNKEDIDRLLTYPLNEEEIIICRKNHLLTNAREHIITGSREPGSIYFKTHEGKEKQNGNLQRLFGLLRAGQETSYFHKHR